MKTRGEGPIQHFTDAAGVRGITSLETNTLQIGQPVEVVALSFGQGANTFLAGSAGDIFVTEAGPFATTGQLQRIGVFGDKQNYVIEFSRESVFRNNARLTPLFPARGIYGLPAGTRLDHADYLYTVTRRQ